MILSTLLFDALEKNYPRYYKSIGQPKVFVIDERFPPWESYMQRLRSANFAYTMVLKGIPKNFPKDTTLRNYARSIRYLLTALIILFVTLIIVGFLAFGRTGLT